MRTCILVRIPPDSIPPESNRAEGKFHKHEAEEEPVATFRGARPRRGHWV